MRGLGKIKHPLDQGADAVDPLLDIVGQPAGRIGLGQFFGQELHVEIDGGQGVANLVGDTGGKLSQGGQPVDAPHQEFVFFLFGQVADDEHGADERPLMVAQKR